MNCGPCETGGEDFPRPSEGWYSREPSCWGQQGLIHHFFKILHGHTREVTLTRPQGERIAETIGICGQGNRALTDGQKRLALTLCGVPLRSNHITVTIELQSFLSV
jgi:hypothetical protein